ncbi:MAG: PLP-dependent transferase [Bdellovibrionales bacterium]|nr:PLP-dependent transferase [Bdellovibrionales bacterium]
MSDYEAILQQTIENTPVDWLQSTTHRLDIYNEKLAKFEFLEEFEALNDHTENNLSQLPTAFDYVRLGHPLSSVLEWAIAKKCGLKAESVVAFASQTMPLLAIMRKNKFLNRNTRVASKGQLPKGFDKETLNTVYGYNFEVEIVDTLGELSLFEGCTVYIESESEVESELANINFALNLCGDCGSIVRVLNDDHDYIKEIQHVRRRESIAMTPQSCFNVLTRMVGKSTQESEPYNSSDLEKTIQSITRTSAPVALGTSGLSVQYAIMMGLIDHAMEHHPSRDIKFIVPPNCYGGTNDQARRVADAIDNVEIVDLPVDSGKNMVTELERILSEVANQDAVPYIIAEIPTNPRVEIPDLIKLRQTLKKKRQTSNGEDAIEPVFILDQTFCPNVIFFGDTGHLYDVCSLSYVSGSKFPSGGRCTAGYCVANPSASKYMFYVLKHLKICDNAATKLQREILTEKMPTMNKRIDGGYKNTLEFTNFIKENLPEAKINFVTEELAEATFTPSVFSLDLPTKGETEDEKEAYKREANDRLIRMMIESIPEESKHCVSYGQLKGCYWTIPATSTQGTTKESDKDYIVRVSIAADFDIEKHKAVFLDFCKTL